MKVKVCKIFFDEKEQVERKAGEVFECTEERFKVIKTKLPEWVESAEPKKATAKKTATKANMRK